MMTTIHQFEKQPWKGWVLSCRIKFLLNYSIVWTECSMGLFSRLSGHTAIWRLKALVGFLWPNASLLCIRCGIWIATTQVLIEFDDFTWINWPSNWPQFVCCAISTRSDFFQGNFTFFTSRDTRIHTVGHKIKATYAQIKTLSVKNVIQ